jgi:hypothetical protein
VLQVNYGTARTATGTGGWCLLSGSAARVTSRASRCRACLCHGPGSVDPVPNESYMRTEHSTDPLGRIFALNLCFSLAMVCLVSLGARGTGIVSGLPMTHAVIQLALVAGQIASWSRARATRRGRAAIHLAAFGASSVSISIALMASVMCAATLRWASPAVLLVGVTPLAAGAVLGWHASGRAWRAWVKGGRLSLSTARLDLERRVIMGTHKGQWLVVPAILLALLSLCALRAFAPMRVKMLVGMLLAMVGAAVFSRGACAFGWGLALRIARWERSTGRTIRLS